ncbi:MAG: hypothetical protein AVDCRST_MAG52-1836, partial [uncultured Blastococcus sp.]
VRRRLGCQHVRRTPARVPRIAQFGRGGGPVRRLRPRPDAGIVAPGSGIGSLGSPSRRHPGVVAVGGRFRDSPARRRLVHGPPPRSHPRRNRRRRDVRARNRLGEGALRSSGSTIVRSDPCSGRPQRRIRRGSAHCRDDCAMVARAGVDLIHRAPRARRPAAALHVESAGDHDVTARRKRRGNLWDRRCLAKRCLPQSHPPHRALGIRRCHDAFRRTSGIGRARRIPGGCQRYRRRGDPGRWRARSTVGAWSRGPCACRALPGRTRCTRGGDAHGGGDRTYALRRTAHPDFDHSRRGIRVVARQWIEVRRGIGVIERPGHSDQHLLRPHIYRLRVPAGRQLADPRSAGATTARRRRARRRSRISGHVHRLAGAIGAGRHV